MKSFRLATATALTCWLTGFHSAAAQESARSIELVLPDGPVPQGSNFSLGLQDSGTSDDGQFKATKVCVVAANGTNVTNCMTPGYVSFSISQLGINDTTGDWDIGDSQACIGTPQAGSTATYSFGFNSASWPAGNYTAFYERILLFGTNGTSRSPGQSGTEQICIYPPFSKEIVQVNATIQIVDEGSNGSSGDSGSQVQQTTSSASFETAVPRPSNTGSGARLACSAVIVVTVAALSTLSLLGP